MFRWAHRKKTQKNRARRILASERGRISVKLGRARGKYDQPKNYDVLYYAYIVAILNEPITTLTRAKNKTRDYNKNNGRCK